MNLFKLGDDLSPTTKIILVISGIGLILLLWIFLTYGETPIMSSGILPPPWRVFTAFGDMYRDNELIRNTCLSLGMNLSGYLEAILLSIPLGFLIGLWPVARSMFQRPVDALRYVPLTAVIGLFIGLFGIGIPMKVHFLAFGILIYLLPVVVQRLDEVDDVYLKTVYTLGANAWQTIRTVYFPAVISRLSDDIRVLTAISWTYIIFAEMMGSEGGIGAMIWRVGQRQGRFDKIWALLVLIMIIGIVQDKLFTIADRHLFPHKYQQAESEAKGQMKEESLWSVIWTYLRKSLFWTLIGAYLLLFINEFTGIISGIRIFHYLFDRTAIAVHLIMWVIIVVKGAEFYREWAAERRKSNVQASQTT